MGKIRELFSDTLVYGISSVVARFINYLLVPFYTKYFDPAAYGVIGLIYGAIIFLNVLFTFGMESSYLRYGVDREKARDVFRTIQVALLGGASLLVALSWLMKPLLASLVGLEPGSDIVQAQSSVFSCPFSLFYMMLGILWIDALSLVPFAELRLIRKTWTYAFIRLFNVVINVSLNLYLVIIAGWGIEAVLFSNLVASLFAAVVLFGFTAHMYRGRWDPKLLRRVLWFGLPYVPAGLAHAVNEVLGRFAVNNMPHDTVSRLYGDHYTADDITGIFNACYKMSVFMLLAVQMFRMAWLPFFMRQSGSEDARKTYAEVFTWFNIAAAVVFITVGIFVEQIVRIRIPLLDGTLIDARYWSGLFIVPWLLMAYWFQGWFLNFIAGVFIREKMWYLAGVTLAGALITITGNLLLVPVYGMQGAAWVTLTCFFSMAMLMYMLTQKFYRVPYNMLKNFGVLVFSGLAVAFSNGFSSTETPFFESLLAKMLLFVLCLLIISVVAYFELNRRPPVKKSVN